MPTWQIQQAKANFSELIDTAEKEGPQIITRRGVETAVIVPIEEWRKLRPGSNEALLEVLQSGPKFDIPIPPRGRHRHRKPILF